MSTQLLSINQLKQVQLEVMDYFHNWCEQHDISYFITAGTLIGALRHKGFIPWDDDIDVVMLRTDYDRLMHIFPKSETCPYQLHSIETDPSCIYTYAKLCDTRTVFIDGDEHNNVRIGVNIDIFPLENATDCFDDAVKLKESIKLYDSILTIKQMGRKDRGFWKNTAVALLKSISCLIPFNWLIHKVIEKATIYRTNVQSKYVVNAVIYAKGEKEILEREWFNSTIYLEFEGRLYRAPVGADQYLKRLFGDYMELPPEEKRVSHHYFKAFFKD